jgi:hypothetical protein
VLPVDAQMTAREPDAIARATATTMPRSLNEPVGFIPSILAWSRGTPIAAPSRGSGTSGVLPSPSVSAGRAPGSGRNSP